GASQGHLADGRFLRSVSLSTFPTVVFPGRGRWSNTLGGCIGPELRDGAPGLVSVWSNNLLETILGIGGNLLNFISQCFSKRPLQGPQQSFEYGGIELAALFQLSVQLRQLLRNRTPDLPLAGLL